MRSSYLSRKNSWIPTEKFEFRHQWRKIQHLYSSNALRLILAWTSIVRKVQGLSLEQGAADFDLRKQKPFGPGQIYTGLSWVKTYNIYCIGEFDKSEIKANKYLSMNVWNRIIWVWTSETE